MIVLNGVWQLDIYCIRVLEHVAKQMAEAELEKQS